MSDLPRNWTTTKLEEIAVDISYGYTAPSTVENVGPHLLRITDIQDNNVAWSSVPHCEIDPDQAKRYLLKENDLVFARTGATVGKSFLIKGQIPESVFASYLIRVRSLPPASANYLAYYFRSKSYWQQITEFSTGIGQPNVNGSKLKALQIPLAPFTEQIKIAQKLDELLAQVDTLKARIDTIPALLKRFRQSVITAAVDGKLTELWRQDSGLSFEWPHIKFAELTEEFRGGASQKPFDLTAGTPVVRSSAVRSMAIDLSDVRYFDPETELNNRDFIQKNDLLFTRLSGSAEFVGICALVKAEPKVPTQFPDRLFCARLKDKKITKYLEIFFSSRRYLDYIRENLKSSAGHQRITTETVKNTLICLPPIDEQAEIVRRVEQLFAFADQLETKVQNAKERIDKLTQSILAKAFRGELVPQDPNDEPASVLLERIKAQRAAEPKGKRGRKKAESA